MPFVICLFNVSLLLTMLFRFQGYLPAIEKYMKMDDWYMWVHMAKGSVTMPIFQSLDAYWPGLQVRGTRAVANAQIYEYDSYGKYRVSNMNMYSQINDNRNDVS